MSSTETSMTSSDGSDTGTSNVASPNGSRILPSENYIQPIHVSTPNARLSNPNAFVGMRNQGDMFQVQSDIINGDLSNKNQQQGSNVAQQVSFLVSKIGRMESEIHELRRTVISLMQTLITTPTYSETVSRRNSTEGTQSSPNSLEGARMPDISNINRSNSVQEIPPEEPPRPIPVIVSRGSNVPQNRENSGKPAPATHQNRQRETADTRQQRVLFLGDSIIKGVNTKGLAHSVHKHSTSGGNIQTLIDEINLYDLNVFSTIIVYIGGNNVARGDKSSFIEEKYDELISLIKCSNNTCKIILCSVAPRVDADISHLNQIVGKLAKHWSCQNVEHVPNTHDMFLKDGGPSTRYFLQDGIHLTASGTKRLLDALNRVFPFVADFDNCVFNGKRPTVKASGGSGFQVKPRRNQGQFRVGIRATSGRFPLVCFGCHRRGHKIAECWYTK